MRYIKLNFTLKKKSYFQCPIILTSKLVCANIFLIKAYGTNAVTAWYNEIQFYNYNNPGFSGATGHFTQVIWKSSTQVGCGLSVNYQRQLVGTTYWNFYMAYVSCNYSPAGNNISNGQFALNVLAKK